MQAEIDTLAKQMAQVNGLVQQSYNNYSCALLLEETAPHFLYPLN